jgi:hypothetical protein
MTSTDLGSIHGSMRSLDSSREWSPLSMVSLHCSRESFGCSWGDPPMLKIDTLRPKDVQQWIQNELLWLQDEPPQLQGEPPRLQGKPCSSRMILHCSRVNLHCSRVNLNESLLTTLNCSRLIFYGLISHSYLGKDSMAPG